MNRPSTNSSRARPAGWRARLGATALALAAALGAYAQDPIPMLHDDFDAATLDPAWTSDASNGNTLALADGRVEIVAAENTFAHLERALDQDLIRAACTLQPGNGISWATSLFLYWGPGDWCQIGVIPRQGGRYYACVTANGRRDEYDLARCSFDTQHTVALELAEDGIRFLTRAATQDWHTLTFVDRPPTLAGPPQLLVVGKGYGLDAGAPDLDGDYGERGAVATSWIDRVTVTPTPADRRQITPAERQLRQAALQDPHGLAILQRGVDPDYDTVAAVYPPLRKPREAVGVQDHPYEVGVESDGTIQIADDSDLWEQTGSTAYFEVGDAPARFGTGGCEKRLLDGFLPVVVAEWSHDGLACEQMILGWSEGMRPEKPLWAYARLAVANPAADAREVPVTLRIAPPTEDVPPLRQALAVPARGQAAVCVRIPSPLDGRRAEIVPAEDFEAKLRESAQAWTKLVHAGLRIAVPERRVNDAWRAWLAYNFLDVDEEDGRYVPHDGAGFYEEPFGYSAVLYCHALDLWGHHDDARRYLESMLTFQKDDGLFFVRYGLPDHGAMMLALAEHYRLSGDETWLKQVAPRLVRMCAWTIAARERALQEERPATTRGLIRFTPYADFQAQTFNFYGDAYCCIGLEHAADVLNAAGRDEDAARAAQAAREYRGDILAAMEAATIEHAGLRMLPIEPDTQRILKEAKYRAGGYYGLVASMLLESEFLPADDPRAQRLVQALEQRGGLILGMCEFNEGIDHAYTYGYWLNCLQRGEIGRVLLGFYGSLAYGMGRETYCGVEVTDITTGEPTPTTPHLYSGTQQLRLLRMMLLREQGDALVLGQAIPRHWLAGGQRVEAEHAPTRFGGVSVRYDVAQAGDVVEVVVTPAWRTPPARLVVHVRHPSGRPIRSVERRSAVDGQPGAESRPENAGRAELEVQPEAENAPGAGATGPVTYEGQRIELPAPRGKTVLRVRF